MGLDFTTIKDQIGSAIFLIHDGTDRDKEKFNQLAESLRTRSNKQIIVMSSDENNAQKIVSFYKLRGTHFVLIVRDDDQLHHVWFDGDNFDASQILYIAEQAG